MVAPERMSCWAHDEMACGAQEGTHAAHSPLCGVDTLDDHGERHKQSNSTSSGGSFLDDAYRSLETPRATAAAGEGGASTSTSSSSVCATIHIQIESVPLQELQDPSHPRRRPSHHSRLPQGAASTTSCAATTKTSWTRLCSAWKAEDSLFLRLLVIVVPPVLVVLLLQFSVAYCMLFVLNGVVAMAAWQWSWWSFRIRQRLLAPFQAVTVPVAVGNSQQLPREACEQAQEYAINHQSLALTCLTTKFQRQFRDHKYLIATLLAATVSGVAASLLWCCAEEILTDHQASAVGHRVLLLSGSSCCFAVVFCGLLSPSLADGFVVMVYQVAFVVSSLNSFFAHHDHLVHDPELLDSMYVLLVAVCAIVVWRIVSSKEVLESTIMAMLDMLGLAYLVAPLMAMADFLGHPSVNEFHDVVGAFFMVVSAAEVAFLASNSLVAAKTTHSSSSSSSSPWWRRAVLKNLSSSLTLGSVLFSCLMGLSAAVVLVLCLHGHLLHFYDLLVLLGVILMSQFGRLALESMKEMARANHNAMVTYQPWVGGVLELVNPYVVAMIIFHPYIKVLIKT